MRHNPAPSTREFIIGWRATPTVAAYKENWDGTLTDGERFGDADEETA